MEEDMIAEAALAQAMGGGMGGGMPAPAAPPAGDGTGLVTIEVPEFALPYIAELLSSLTSGGGGAPMM